MGRLQLPNNPPPLQIPDLNPIELLWDHLDHMRQLPATSANTLGGQLQTSC